jgi:protein-tyrosine phosphatase
VRYAITFWLLGICWIALAIDYRGPAWVLVWPGASFLFAGAAYAGAGPGIFGKRPDGSMTLIRLLAVFPYVGLAWCIWAVVRQISSEAPAHEVAARLWIGRRPTRGELPNNVDLIVDLTCELWESAAVRSARTYLCIPTLDGSMPSISQLQELVERIMQFDGVALIHCAQGHGRSAAVAAAVLVTRGDADDVDQAIRQIQHVRPAVRVSQSQRRAVTRAIQGASGITSPPQAPASRRT